jgi:hypothetical protein
MITTQSYNDFSSFSSDEKRDYNFMLEQIKKFKDNGGDLSLPVKVSNNVDKGIINLISFDDFIIKHIEAYNDFFIELSSKGIIKNKRLPTICDFTWDAATGSITEKQGYGMYWMRDNFKEFKEQIFQSFKNLLEDLPDDLSKATIYNQINHYGKIEARSLNHPLYTITKEIDQPELYELILKSRPEIKKEFLTNSRVTKEPNFLHIINIHQTHNLKNDTKAYETAIIFYKNGIGREYFHQTKNLDELHTLIRKASYTGDTEFLNLALPNINLHEMEQNKDSRDISLTWAKNAEVANILFNHNAVVEASFDTPNGKVTNNLILNDELTKLDVLDLMLQKFPQYQEQIKSDPKPFYHFMQQRPFGFTKLLVEKYQFPLENFDMLSVAYKRTTSDTYEDYKWLAQNGADLRENALFCAEMVNKRDIGLKLIRGLNNEGIIVSKSADFIFNIFQNNPTKIFLTYYEKLSAVELEKTTKKGLPAWWGAKAHSDYMFMFKRIKNYDQTAQDGRNLLFNVLEMQLEHRGINPQSIINLQLKKLHAKEPEYKLDLSYTDENGNNFMHHLLSFRRNYKDNLNLDLLELLKNNSQQNPFEFLSKENKEGISPLDLLLTQDNMSNYDLNKTLTLIIEEAPEYIQFNKVLTTGKTIADYFKEEFNHDPSMKSYIDAIILSQELESSGPKSKKIKI